MALALRRAVERMDSETSQSETGFRQAGPGFA